jgi:uncharacterized cupredoxin-like copper-binding protein
MLRRACIASLAPLMLALAGCASEAVRVQGHRLTLTLSEYRILPDSVSAPAGTLVIVAHNRGILTHDVAIERKSQAEAPTPVVLATTGTIKPGASGRLQITLHRPGRYELLSTIANQSDLGMNGTLTIR